MDTSLIRPEFVVEYAARKIRDWALHNRLIENRDNAQCQLNRSYGLVELSGDVSSGRKSNDPSYIEKYQSIKNSFEAENNAIKPATDQWIRNSGITIFEYLFIDNCDLAGSGRIIEEASRQNGYFLNAIPLKANVYVDSIKTQHNFSELKWLVDFEIKNHHYALTRCRNFFDFKFWEISKQRNMLSYSRLWKEELVKALGQLKAR